MNHQKADPLRERRLELAEDAVDHLVRRREAEVANHRAELLHVDNAVAVLVPFVEEILDVCRRAHKGVAQREDHVFFEVDVSG